MYKQIITLVTALFLFVNIGHSQDMAHGDKMMRKEATKTITLEQTSGEFSVKGFTLSSGTYQFNIVNNNVGKDVGFVLAPANAPDKHIKEAYVTKAVQNNGSEKTNLVSLTPGEYVYFCPLNKTPQYTLTVK